MTYWKSIPVNYSHFPHASRFAAACNMIFFTLLNPYIGDNYNNGICLRTGQAVFSSYRKYINIRS